MKREMIVLAVIAMALIGMAGAANYMYEKSSVKGVGYRSLEMVISTQSGYEGQKLVEKQTGSGNVILSRIELEAERQPLDMACEWANGYPMDYINFTSEQELEYMPVSYQTGTYDQKWVDKLCVQNYKIGAVLTEMYTHAEHLQKTTEVKTRGYDINCSKDCCTGVLEANINSNVIGVAHVGWLSRDPNGTDALRGRHAEYGRSVEDLTGVFSINKFIQLWGSSNCQSISVDWLPCT